MNKTQRWYPVDGDGLRVREGDVITGPGGRSWVYEHVTAVPCSVWPTGRIHAFPQGPADAVFQTFPPEDFGLRLVRAADQEP